MGSGDELVECEAGVGAVWGVGHDEAEAIGDRHTGHIGGGADAGREGGGDVLAGDVGEDVAAAATAGQAAGIGPGVLRLGVWFGIKIG